MNNYFCSNLSLETHFVIQFFVSFFFPSIGSELLVIVVDANPDTWSALDATAREIDEVSASQATLSSSTTTTPSSTSNQRRLTYGEFVSYLELFIALFACSSRKNQLAVLAYNGTEGGYLYPPLDPTTISTTPSNIPNKNIPMIDLRTESLRPAVVKKYIHQGLLYLRYKDSLTNLSSSSSSSSSLVDPTLLSSLAISSNFSSLGSCLTQALCYINKQKGLLSTSNLPMNTSNTTNNTLNQTINPNNPNQGNYHKLRSRIIVFQASPDNAAQYIQVINVFCSAARYSIPIDSVLLGTSASIFLQQAASLTNAQHLRPDPAVGHFAGFYQYLITLLLPDIRTRQDLLLPPQNDVDLRAHCFCHQQHVTTAWLCFVCLSIWCKQLDICRTCGTGKSTKKIN